MLTRLLRLRTLAAAGLLLLSLTVACTPSAPPGEAAGEVGAHPDFSGVWMTFAVENPDGGGNEPRYSAAGRAALDAFVAQFREIPETGAACVGTGMPGVMLSTVSYPIELVQTPSRILMVAELETQVRRVFLDGRDHPEGTFPSGVGDSIGTWDGGTLVIDTALLEEWQLRPWPRSNEAHIVERMSLTKLADVSARPTGFVAELDAAINDDVLVDEITLTDPAYYDGPQRRTAYYQRVADSATTEYGCSKGLWFDELEEQRIAQSGSSRADAPPSRSTPLAGTSWQLVEFQSMDDAQGVTRADDPSKYVMELDADGTLAMRLNCNRARGTWSASVSADGTSGSIELGPLAMTRASCPPPSLDEQIARQAEYVRGYVLRDGRLYLSLMADGGIYVWEPLAEPR